VIGEQYKINDFVWVVPVQCKCGTKAAIPRQRLFKGLSRSCVKCARKRGWR
jgi:hypothetical protein